MKKQPAKTLLGKSVANPKVSSDMKMSSPPCNGKKGEGRSRKPPNHKESSFHQMIPEFICQGGGFICQGSYFTAGKGTGVESIYSSMSIDQKVVKKPTGPRSNGSQSIICTTKTKWVMVKNVGQLP